MRSLLFLIVPALVCTHPPASRAGAFLQNEGEGVVISGGRFSDSTTAYDAAGRLQPIPQWRKFELSTYAEYGLTDWLTLVAAPSWFTFHEKPPDSSRDSTAVGELGARAKIYQWDSNVVSAQATVRSPLGGAAALPYVDMTRAFQIDARFGLGRPFEIYGFRGFGDFQAGVRTSGAFGGEARLDSTIGIWPLESVLVLLQSFTAVSPRSWGVPRSIAEKIQASAVYWFTPKVGLQLGAAITTRGINSSSERGIFSALWYRF